MRRIRGHLTYANIVSTLALFLVVAGGVAYAANTVFSSDIVNNEVYSADVRNDTLAGGGLGPADLRPDAVGTSEIATGGVRSGDVQAEALTGADIANQSGVDTCATGVRRGQLCVRAENFHRPFNQAVAHCGNLSMRVPSFGEAHELVRSHDIPDLDEHEFFWTDERFYDPDFDFQLVYTLSDDGTQTSHDLNQPEEDSAETVCVTNPTN